jgi:DNA topoisomerase I
MSVAQRLYERGFITYMRTDSTNLSEQAVNGARAQIQQLYGPDYLPAQPRSYQKKVKNAQEAHEAIRPAGEVFRTPDQVRGQLDADEQRLYELVWMRTVACQMADARGRRVSARLEATSTTGELATFGASGRTIEFPATCGPTSRAPTTPTPSWATARSGCRPWRRATRCPPAPSRPTATRPSRPPATPRRAS